ncbi:MAG TPA: alpha/beta fold hydrolase, partial [Pirellulales bacterium]
MTASSTSPTGRSQTEPSKAEALPWTWPTFGGLQFWSDVHLFRDWRIQRHAYRDEHRLLGPANLRWASGSEEHCRLMLDRVIAGRRLEPLTGTAVVVLHGLIRTRHSMAQIARRLRREGHAVYNLSYCSTRRPIPWHADNLRRVLAGLEQHAEIHLVGYSLGGLVIRAALANHDDPRVRRVVTIGTPHLGAEKADKWAGWPLFDFVAGETGWQLGTGERSITRVLPPTLNREFGVIAGGRGRDRGYSPILPGDNDWTVTVASTRLPGAADFLLVRAPHSLLTHNRQVQDATASFLEHGWFRSADLREPIPLAAQSSAPT